MDVYRMFVRRLLRNYVIGASLAVFGVGSIYILSTMSLSLTDILWWGLIFAVSGTVMFVCEYLVLRRHLRPIRNVFREGEQGSVPFEWLDAAYQQAHRFPTLAVRRTLGPHLLGFAVPGAALSAWLIHLSLLSFPYHYVLLATLGCVLIAGMHAVIEYFLTTEAIRPLLSHLRSWSLAAHGRELTLGGRVLVTTRRKMTLSAILISTFPVLLFALATEVRFGESDVRLHGAEYWQWAGIVLLLGIGFAAVSAVLMARAVREPIERIYDLTAEVQQGGFGVRVEDLYSDEFSRLVTGFNLMVQGLRGRDEMNAQLVSSYFSTLAAALDARDPYTAGHSLRVARYSVVIGQRCGLPQDVVERLNKSALLHDIGKIGIRDDVLFKEGRLTDAEFEQIKQHPVLGEAILKEIQPAETMAPLLPGVRSHHERFDGRGYPDGLAGEAIPLFGRIIAVADAYDAMTSDRPYRKGMQVEKALSILEEGSGTQWDPQFAGIFIRWVREEAGGRDKK